MLIKKNKNQKNINYFKVETGQVPFWGAKGISGSVARAHGRVLAAQPSPTAAQVWKRLSPVLDAICFTGKIKKRGVSEHPKHRLFGGEKNNPHNCGLSNSSNLQILVICFKMYMGKRKQTEKTYTDITSKMEPSHPRC